MQILCLGDSITDCGRIFDAPPLGWGYVHLLQEISRSQGHGYSVSNHGMDGLTLMGLLQRILQGSIPAQGDIITVLIGINDISLMLNTRRSSIQQKAMMDNFGKNYHRLLDVLDSPRIILMEPFLFPRPAEYLNWLPYLYAMSQEIASIAHEKQMPYVHLHKRLNEEAERLGIDAITTDGIHLTLHGHQIIAETLSQFL